MKTMNQNGASTIKHTIGSNLQSCKELLRRVEQARNAVINEFRATKESHEGLFKQALNEAEALAWQTAYPHLVFPWLAVEKVQAITAWLARQQFLHQQQAVFAEAA